MSKNIIFLLVAAIVVATISAVILGLNIFSVAGAGYVVGTAVGAVGIAIILTFVPAGTYWLFKRKRMPGFNITIWILWGLIAVLSLIGNLM